LIEELLKTFDEFLFLLSLLFLLLLYPFVDELIEFESLVCVDSNNLSL